jgi:hypothetical protein
MADTKISALPASTTPLVGTEVLPIVQSSTTKQVSVANLTAGRAISATSVTASTGNFVVGTSGQGIDFSATPGTGTSELLADYEEGTWTPVDTSGASLTLTNEATATYTKIGRQVTASFWVKYPVTASGAGATIGGLPFTSASGVGGSVVINQTEYASAFTGAVQQGTAQMTFFTFGNTQLTNLNFSNLRVRATAIYFV